MLSKRITAKSRDAKPASQASVSTVTVMSVLKPAVLLNNPLLRPSLGFAVAVAGILEPLAYIQSNSIFIHRFQFTHESISETWLFFQEHWFDDLTDGGRTDTSLSKIIASKKKICQQIEAPSGIHRFFLFRVKPARFTYNQWVRKPQNNIQILKLSQPFKKEMTLFLWS